MARFNKLDMARANAQANANQTGERWVVFLDTSNVWNAERYNPTVCACHNDSTATVIEPRTNHRGENLTLADRARGGRKSAAGATRKTDGTFGPRKVDSSENDARIAAGYAELRERGVTPESVGENPHLDPDVATWMRDGSKTDENPTEDKAHGSEVPKPRDTLHNDGSGI